MQAISLVLMFAKDDLYRNPTVKKYMISITAKSSTLQSRNQIMIFTQSHKGKEEASLSYIGDNSGNNIIFH